MALIIRIHCHVIFCNCYVTFSLQFSIPKMLHPGVDFLPFPPSCTTYRQVLAVLSKTTLRIKSLVEEQEHLCTCGMGDYMMIFYFVKFLNICVCYSIEVITISLSDHNNIRCGALDGSPMECGVGGQPYKTPRFHLRHPSPRNDPPKNSLDPA